jgi:hypothetical protein
VSPGSVRLVNRRFVSPQSFDDGEAVERIEFLPRSIVTSWVGVAREAGDRSGGEGTPEPPRRAEAGRGSPGSLRLGWRR